MFDYSLNVCVCLEKNVCVCLEKNVVFLGCVDS